MKLVVRADLPAVDAYESLSRQLADMLTRNEIDTAVVVVVGGKDTEEPDLPHRPLLAACEEVFESAGIRVVAKLWAADTRGGQPWRCYDDDGCGGAVPDPRSSVVAAASAAAGVVLHDRREDLAATLAPADDDVLAGRAQLLQGLSENDFDPLVDGLLLLRAAIDRAVEGTLPESDAEFVALARALADYTVRDACIVLDDEPHAAAAERLWASLVRGLPAPERAEPACLLAFAAYLRGDGAQVSTALDVAEHADPVHRFTELLRSAISVALPPTRLRKAGEEASRFSREALGDPSLPDSPKTPTTTAETPDVR
jgi:hypothetical protein